MRILYGAGLWLILLQSVRADPVEVEEIFVVGEKVIRKPGLVQTVDVQPDTAALLKKVAGANVVNNGPLSGIAQYRGMSRFRIGTKINGATISAGGPNWMDPPLSYAPAAHLESIEVYRGIASVSVGAETIGGAIHANTWQGRFSETGVASSGRVRTGAQSANHGKMISAALALANDKRLMKVSGLKESGSDAEFAEGAILPMEYKRQRYDVGVGLREGRHTFRVDFGLNETGHAGNPALPMDIDYIDADLLTVGWNYARDGLRIDSTVHISDIRHGMTNYRLRKPPQTEAMWRRNTAAGDNRGFTLSVALGDWKFGLDGHAERHDSYIDNPNRRMFFVENFNNARRFLLGIFVEREFLIGDALLMELGMRYNRVTLDADPVNATPAMLGMPAAVTLREGFNDAERRAITEHFDWVAKFSYPLSTALTLQAGLSRKSRAPAYQEKFLWLPLQATAGLADGYAYTGNLDLNAETAHELEFGLDWYGASAAVSPRVFYRDVHDYIQGTESNSTPAVMFVQMMNDVNGTDNPPPLQFNNTDAKFYGLDVDWRYAFDERWSINGTVNFVRARRDDIEDELYRVSSPNAFMALNYAHPDWSLSLESFIYDAQDKVSRANGETATSGYALFNLKGSWRIAAGFELGFGLENVTDRHYVDHLAGINRVRGNPDIDVGERLPGIGRSYFARLDYSW